MQFDVNINRSTPLQFNEYSRDWEQAWEELKFTANETLIGITAFFAIFILWAVRIAIYLLVVLVIIRALWKFAKLLWKKW